MTTDQILELLDEVKTSGSGWVARCPSHDDSSASLSISEGEDGKTLWHCHAGCTQEDVRTSLGLSGGKSDRQEPEAVYDYTDETGALLYQVLRMPPEGGRKRFQQRQPDGEGGWIWNMQGTRRVLYRLPEVIQAVAQGEIVVITEGEKDADAVKQYAGKTATSSLGGAGGWKKEYAQHLKGAKVYIVADKDDPGRNHAEAIRKSLVGVAAEVYAVEAREGKDAFDHLVTHGLPLEDMLIADLRDVSDETALSAVELKSVEWHWKPFVQVAAFHLLAGEGGVGKGVWLAALSAAITTGRTEHLCEPRNVIIISSEDSAGTDLLPRVLAAGGDPARVIILHRSILLPKDTEYLEEKIDQQRNGYGTGLVIIDPVANHIGGASSDEESAVRHAINELNHVADRTGCAIIGVRHLNKSGGVLGSVAWVNSPRTVLSFAQDEHRTHDTSARVLKVEKSNRGSRGNRLKYSLGAVQVPGVTGEVPILTKGASLVDAIPQMQEVEPDAWFIQR